jgi:Uma2 family endonuclease
MPLIKEEMKTVDYIYALPEGERSELIDGAIYDMAPPSVHHQRIARELSADLTNYIRKNNGKCEAFFAPFAVFLNNDEYNYVELDIAVNCDKDKIDDKGCHGAPDFIIEIVSPSSRNMDYMIKLFKYRSAGVREYWIVDPDKQMVRTYNYIKNETADYPFTESIPVGIYPGFELKINI